MLLRPMRSSPSSFFFVVIPGLAIAPTRGTVLANEFFLPRNEL